jgi:hypothetical protein
MMVVVWRWGLAKICEYVKFIEFEIMRGKLVMVLYPKRHTKVMYEGTWRSLKIEKYGFVGSWFVVVVVRAFWFVVGYSTSLLYF